MHWLLHYPLSGDAANFNFVDESSLLSEPDNEDKDWLKGTGFLSIIIIYN